MSTVDIYCGLLLHILSPCYSAFFNWREPITFKELRLITLLAVKYKINHIIRHAIDRLETAFPVNLSYHHLGPNEFVFNTGTNSVVYGLHDSIGAVVLAHAIGAQNPPLFIASALYYCCQLPPSQLFLTVQYGNDLVQLSRNGLMVCAAALSQLTEADKDIRQTIEAARLHEPKCGIASCRKGLADIVQEHGFTSRHATYEALHWSDSWFDRHAAKYPDSKLCARCELRIKNAMTEQRRKLFKALGILFSIKEWHYLG